MISFFFNLIHIYEFSLWLHECASNDLRLLLDGKGAFLLSCRGVLGDLGLPSLLLLLSLHLFDGYHDIRLQLFFFSGYVLDWKLLCVLWLTLSKLGVLILQVRVLQVPTIVHCRRLHIVDILPGKRTHQRKEHFDHAFFKLYCFLHSSCAVGIR